MISIAHMCNLVIMHAGRGKGEGREEGGRRGGEGERGGREGEERWEGLLHFYYIIAI